MFEKNNIEIYDKYKHADYLYKKGGIFKLQKGSNDEYLKK
jgi:hypothetical protein